MIFLDVRRRHPGWRKGRGGAELSISSTQEAKRHHLANTDMVNCAICLSLDGTVV
jgi:hypothetical protein